MHCFVLVCIALLCIHCIAFFDNLECPGNVVTTKNAKTFSTIKNAVGKSLTTKNAKRNLLTIKSAKAIFGILRFRPGNQALEAQGTQSGGPGNPGELHPRATRGRGLPAQTQGGRIPGQPGVAASWTKPPITLGSSKNPFRQSLIEEKNDESPQMSKNHPGIGQRLLTIHIC